jgi:hypothetical protein
MCVQCVFYSVHVNCIYLAVIPTAISHWSYVTTLYQYKSIHINCETPMDTLQLAQQSPSYINWNKLMAKLIMK